jgi:hypothetical protein
MGDLLLINRCAPQEISLNFSYISLARNTALPRPLVLAGQAGFPLLYNLIDFPKKVSRSP